MSEVLVEFTWPAPYTLKDDYIGHIVIEFPKSKVVFLEEFESNMNLYFPDNYTKKRKGNYFIFHALRILRPEAEMNKDFEAPVIEDYSVEFASLEKHKKV